MPFNGPIDGDYTNVDFGKAPWTQECMTLTHEECLQVLEGFETVIANYDPTIDNNGPISEMLLHSGYNKLDWQYAISWATFTTLRAYNPEINLLGIDITGIVYPEPEPQPEEPTEEPPAEEPTEEQPTE